MRLAVLSFLGKITPTITPKHLQRVRWCNELQNSWVPLHTMIAESIFIYFCILFGKTCSVITEPILFWNELISVSRASRGLPNPYRIVLGIVFGNIRGAISEPKLFWN